MFSFLYAHNNNNKTRLKGEFSFESFQLCEIMKKDLKLPSHKRNAERLI